MKSHFGLEDPTFKKEFPSWPYSLLIILISVSFSIACYPSENSHKLMIQVTYLLVFHTSRVMCSHYFNKSAPFWPYRFPSTMFIQVLQALCSLCLGRQGGAVRLNQDLIYSTLLPQRDLLLQTKLVDQCGSVRPNIFVGIKEVSCKSLEVMIFDVS